MSKRTAKPAPAGPIEPPEMPPKTEKELAHSRDMTAKLRQLAADLRQRNLDNAVHLAQQAAAGYGPLVEHFAELGRRYGDELRWLAGCQRGEAGLATEATRGTTASRLTRRSPDLDKGPLREGVALFRADKVGGHAGRRCLVETVSFRRGPLTCRKIPAILHKIGNLAG